MCQLILELFLMIKVGTVIGALNTILLIIFTALTGVYFAKLEGLNTMRSGFSQMIKNEIPIYEIVSGAALAFAAFLLIFPGFITDAIGFMLIIPFTRKIILSKILYKFFNKKNKKNYVDAEFEEIEEDQNNKNES